MNNNALEARMSALQQEWRELVTQRFGADALHRESLPLHPNMHLELRGPDGELKEDRWEHNLICTAGLNQILEASGAQYVNGFAYCAIGTGATAASASDTALQTEIARTTVITPTNPSAGELQFVATYAPGVGTGAITESGLLSAASVGYLLCHQVFSVINKGAGDTLTVTWQIT